MQNKNYLLPVKETLVNAWDAVKGSKGTFWAAIGITFLIAIAVGFVSGLAASLSDILGSLFNLAGQIITTLLQIGLIYIGIQRAKNMPINYKQVFHAFHVRTALNIFGVYAIVFLIFVPLILLMLIPVLYYGTQLSTVFSSGFTISNIVLVSWWLLGGLVAFYINLRLILSVGFVIDKDQLCWDAVKMSYKATNHNALNILSILLTQFVIFLIAMLPLGIGLIWVLPFVLIVYGMLYKNLQANLN